MCVPCRLEHSSYTSSSRSSWVAGGPFEELGDEVAGAVGDERDVGLQDGLDGKRNDRGSASRLGFARAGVGGGGWSFMEAGI